MREKWLNATRAEDKAKRREREWIEAEMHSSDEDIRKKKKGVGKKVKGAVRKTAKISKSGAKGAANAVMDPKRMAKKAGKVANQVGKETAKMVKDPSLVAKRCTKGIKETVNLTANVAKGGFEATSSLAKRGLKGIAKEKKDDDPRLSSDRQTFRDKLAERLTIYDDNTRDRNKKYRKLVSGSSEIQFPPLKFPDKTTSKSNSGWWDI